MQHILMLVEIAMESPCLLPSLWAQVEDTGAVGAGPSSVYT